MSSPLAFNIEVTPREVIFSIFIIGILYAIGFLIAGHIEKHIAAKNLKYRQAIQIRDNGFEVKHASDTDVGDAFVEGNFYTVDPVSWNGLGGEHLSIKRDKERYTMHTRTVHYTVTDSKGRSHTKTRKEHYWTWDVIESARKMASRITFCGNEYGTGTFDFSYIGHSVKKVDTGYHKRDVFYYRPKDFRGVVFAQLKEGGIKGTPPVMANMTIESYYKALTNSHGVGIFWICWWIFIGICVYAFVAIENQWLEKGD